MRQDVHKTGPFGLGSMIHVIHVAEDVLELNAWYEDVFGGLVYNGIDQPGYMASEKRSASLVAVSDYCIETIAPDFPLDLDTPFARFYDRCGPHFHSLGWVADDIEGIYEHHKDNDIPCSMVTTNSYSFFFTPPKRTGGLIVEFISGEMPNDPRMRDEWSSLRKMWVNHPLGINGISHVTIGVVDADAAHDTFRNLWHAEELYSSPESFLGSTSRWVRVGQSVLELAQPSSAGPLADHVERFGTMVYAVTFHVRDLSAVETHLASKGIKTTRAADDVVSAEPSDCHGAVYHFTTRLPAGT